MENTIEHFSECDMIVLLLDLARCPGNRYEIAERLLDSFGSLKSVLEARAEQLAQVKGVGRKSADLIRVILPFVRIWERLSMTCPNRIGNAREAEYFCKSLLMGSRHEQFYVICLNSKCQVLGKRKVSDGSLGEVNAYPRVILETALNYNAHSVLLCHNHPGGTNAPSPEDISSTLTVQRLMNGVGILVLDHIIVAGDQMYSMIQHGDIDYRNCR